MLKVDHVAKMFRLPTEQATGLKMAFLNLTKGNKGYTEQHVLRDINFEVRQGDFFGIVIGDMLSAGFLVGSYNFVP